MQEIKPISIDKIYSVNEDFLTEVIKHEKRHYKAIKDKEFIVKLNFEKENFLKNNILKVELLMDQIDKSFPPLQDQNRILQYSYMETTSNSAVIKVIIHSITRSHQAIPFRLQIQSIPQPNCPSPLEACNFSLISDPIIVISRVPKKKSFTEKSKKKNSEQQQQLPQQEIQQEQENPPDLEEISKNIQTMMKMLQNQSSLLNKMSTKIDNPKIETMVYQLDEPSKKKQRPDSINDPLYLGQEPLQASIHNLISQYKEIPSIDKRQKRLRQLLFDLQLQDQELIREFSEVVLDIFDNPVTLQPNPPSFITPPTSSSISSPSKLNSSGDPNSNLNSVDLEELLFSFDNDSTQKKYPF